MTDVAPPAPAAESVDELAPGAKPPEPGVGLCLSGGGYRAMLFHAGVLWRLNELGYLKSIDRISSVSGGSIAAAQLALEWNRLKWNGSVATDFRERVIDPLRELARETIDARSVIVGIALPWKSINDQVIAAYKDHLFGKATLQDFPDRPRFVLNASSVQTGAVVRFSKPYIADYLVGEWRNPTLSVAVAVAASSAFPPFLSPAVVKLPPGAMQSWPDSRLRDPAYTTRLVLTDGGVYDNLGLETVWKNYQTVIVSDGGGQMKADPKPAGDWARHGKRVTDLIDNQVRARRKNQIVGSLRAGHRKGAYWRMRTPIADFSATGTLPCPPDRTLALAETPTRLEAMDDELQMKIINWGYAICDAGMRTYVVPGASAPTGFAYPGAGV